MLDIMLSVTVIQEFAFDTMVYMFTNHDHFHNLHFCVFDKYGPYKNIKKFDMKIFI